MADLKCFGVLPDRGTVFVEVDCVLKDRIDVFDEGSDILVQPFLVPLLPMPTLPIQSTNPI